MFQDLELKFRIQSELNRRATPEFIQRDLKRIYKSFLIHKCPKDLIDRLSKAIANKKEILIF